VLAGGDDYELAFTAPPTLRDAVTAAALSADTPVTRIGRIDAAAGLRLVNTMGQEVPNTYTSFDHFA
jgi:thiamine-monophosphate kinase